MFIANRDRARSGFIHQRLTISGWELDAFILAERYCGLCKQETPPMRSKLSTFALASAALAAAALSIPAMASTSTTLNVPFGFTVDGKDLPAGKYLVVREDGHDFVRLRSVDSSYSFVWMASPSATRSDRVILKFEPQGETHVLESVQSGPLVTRVLNRKSKTTEDVSAQEASGQ
jgi:hypothetical protein